MNDEARQWWRSKRSVYNGNIISALFLAFIWLQVIISASNDPETEVTIFTLAFQLVGCAVVLAAANISYSLGPRIEGALDPRNVRRFRVIAFSAGTLFSIILILLVPVAALLLEP